MKKSIITLCLLASYSLMFGQATYTKEAADKEFKRMNYATAIIQYEKLLAANKADISTLRNLSDAYLKVNDSKDAERILKLLLEQDKTDASILKNLAMALTSNAKYQEAQLYWKKYLAIVPNDVVATNHAQFIDQLPIIEHDSLYIEVYDLNINSHWTEFSPFLVDNNLIFVSNRAIGPIHKVSEWNHTPFLDLYVADTSKIEKKLYKRPLGDIANEEMHISYSDKLENLHDDHTPMTANEGPTLGYYGHHPIDDSMWTKDKAYNNVSSKYNKHLHSKYHEGSVSFTTDKKKMYFTTNDQKSKKVGGIIKLMIAEADLTKKGKYKDAKRLPFNSHQYSVCHPALSSDGITMIFASDMPGGFGGMDLYKVINNNGVWSKPENLGPSVNTTENELFPYVSDDNVLYFSSDGWGGFGGLDVFKKKLNTTENPKNLAYPINTNKDDFGYISIGKQHAYLSSNRKHGGIDDDIYYVFDKRKAQKQLLVITQLKKLNGEIVPLEAVKIVLSTSKEEMANITTVADKPTMLGVGINQTYAVMASHIGLDTIQTTIAISAEVDKNDTLKLLFEETDENIWIASKVIDANTKKGIANATVYVYDSKLQSHQAFITDPEGNYSFKGKKKNNYLIKALHQLYFSDCAQLAMVKAKAKVTIAPLELNKMERSMTFEVKDLYYDYDKSAIRADAGMVLDRLVGFLNEYPNIKVELGSHTDARGSDSYNKELSQDRANAAVAYIVRKGINKNRITAKGYGESQLRNQCRNNVSCTEEAHQLNRRTEIKIPSMSVKENVLPKEAIDANPFEKLNDFESCSKIKVNE